MIKLSILFALLGTNPAVQHNTFIAHIKQPYKTHEACWKDLSRVVINVINKEAYATGKHYDWKVALCIDEQTMKTTYRFSETMEQEMKRRWDEKRI